MRIKKTLFSTEVEFTPHEIEHIRWNLGEAIKLEFKEWFKKKIGLDLFNKRVKPE